MYQYNRFPITHDHNVIDDSTPSELGRSADKNNEITE